MSLCAGSLADSFPVIAKACRQGPNISGAGLWALVRACEDLPCFILHTDSAFALLVWQQVLLAKNVCEFQDHKHFDLLKKRLWQAKSRIRLS